MLQRSYETVFSTNVLKGLMAAVAAVFAFSLYHRYIQQDEPWFGEQAYWLVNEGSVKLKSMPGVFDWTENMLIYHKLFVWSGGLLILVFGWSVYVFKTFILLLFILGAYVLFRFSKTSFESPVVWWLVLLLLFITPELIHRSFMFRPEVMIMTLGFLSFYFLHASVKSEAPLKPAIAGLFAGLAFLTHLNAMVFPVAGFLYMLYFRQWKGLVLFSIAATLTCSVYSLGLWSAEALATYRYQMQNWPTHQSTFGEKVQGGFLGIVGNTLVRLLNEHKRYFWDLDVAGGSGLFLVALVSRFRFLLKEHKNLLIYTLILMGSIGLLTSSHGPRYLVYLMPFMVLITAVVIQSILLEKKTVLKALLLVCFAVQMAFAGLAFRKIAHNSEDHVAIHGELLAQVDQNARVLGPWEMIYNEIDHYSIFSYKTYEYIEDQEKRKLSQLELLELAAIRFDIDYIILDEKRKRSRDFPWFKNWQIEDNPYYQRHKEFNDYLILKRRHPGPSNINKAH